MRDVTSPRIQEELAQALHDVSRLFLVSYYPIIRLISQKKHPNWGFDENSGYLTIQTTGLIEIWPTFPGTIFVSAQMKGATGTISIHAKDGDGTLISQQDLTIVVLQRDHSQDEYVDWITRTNPSQNSRLRVTSIHNILRNLMEVIYH